MAELFRDLVSGEYVYSTDGGKTGSNLGTKDRNEAELRMQQIPTRTARIAGMAPMAKGYDTSQLSPEDRAWVEADLKKSNPKLQPTTAAPLPNERATGLNAISEVAAAQRRDPAFLEAQHQRGAEAGRELGSAITTTGKEILTAPQRMLGRGDAEAFLQSLPAAGGTIGTGLLAKAAGYTPGFVGRRVLGGMGATAGEYIAQKLGISPESKTNLLAAAATGGVLGTPKAGNTVLTEAERSARRTAASGPIANQEAKLRTEAKVGFENARLSPDINTAQMTAPLDNIITKEASRAKPLREMGEALTPEEGTRRQILSSLQAYRDDLGVHLKDFQVSLPEVPIPQEQGLLAKLRRMVGAPERTQIPEILASEQTIPSSPPKVPSPSGIAPATLENTPKTIAPAQTVEEVRPVSRKLAAENVVTDIQQIGRLAQLAEDRGATDLAANIRKSMKEVRALVPGYDEYAAKYAKSKGLGEAKEIIRTSGHPANEVRNLLEGERLYTFTPKEKQAIIRAAEQSEGIGKLTSILLQNPIGQQFVKMGIRPDGTISNSVLNLGLQFIRASKAQPHVGNPLEAAIEGARSGGMAD